jgi:peptidoglycan/LPS O-acetylase OafA/YrhL
MPPNSEVARRHGGDYRPDIDGLRAVSVLVVIAFHFGIATFRSGYVGVDVFFVISGFLITKVIIREIEAGSFSFSDFYVRRLRRLLPAVSVLILGCGLAGFFILSPGDYATFARSALYVLVGGGNFFFLTHTGYFDAAAESMPLLHTWSLGVEEQFYLVWPAILFMLAARSGSRRVLLIVLAGICVLSFLANVAVVRVNHLSVFYLPHYRAWELAFGGLIALAARPISSRRLAELVALLGLALIVGAAIYLPARIAYPGAYALMPVLGAGALLWPSTRPTWVAWLLAASASVFVGKISYSLYLYHWPVLVFWRHYAGTDPLTAQQCAVLVVISFISAWLSWRFVEETFRWRRARRRTVLVVAGLSQAAVAAACAAVMLSGGLTQRIPESVKAIGDIGVMWRVECPYRNLLPEVTDTCVFGRKWYDAKTRIVLIGDSNAGFMRPILQHAIADRDISGIYLTACSVLRADGPFAAGAGLAWIQACERHRRENVAFLKQQDVALVILVSAWASQALGLVQQPDDPLNSAKALDLFEQGLTRVLTDAAAPGRKIALIAEIPKWDIDPIPCVLSQQTPLLRRRCDQDMSKLDRGFMEQNQWSTRERLLKVAHANGVALILPDERLCDEKGCAIWLNGEFIYRDNGHLRRNLAPETFALLAEVFGLPGLLRDLGVVERREGMSN